MSAPTLVDYELSSLQSTEPISVTVPADWTVGNLAVAAVYIGSRTVSTPPAGWANHVVTWDTSVKIVVYWKILEAGDLGGSIIFDLSDAQYNGWVTLFEISGFDPTTPINTAAGDSHGYIAVTSHVSPSVTTTIDDCLILRVARCEQAYAASSGDTGTAVYNAGNRNAWQTEKTTAGVTGTATYTTPESRASLDLTIAISPAAAPSGIKHLPNISGNLQTLSGNLQ